jgi:hypothetical protein
VAEEGFGAFVTAIDVDALEGVPKWVEEVRKFTQDRLMAEVKKLLLSRTQIENSFGGFEHALSVGEKHNQYVRAAFDSYKAVDEALRVFGQGTQDIIKKYRTADERNAANVADITRMLSGNQAGPGAGTAPPPPGDDRAGGY